MSPPQVSVTLFIRLSDCGPPVRTSTASDAVDSPKKAAKGPKPRLQEACLHRIIVLHPTNVSSTFDAVDVRRQKQICDLCQHGEQKVNQTT